MGLGIARHTRALSQNAACSSYAREGSSSSWLFTTFDLDQEFQADHPFRRIQPEPKGAQVPVGVPAYGGGDGGAIAVRRTKKPHRTPRDPQQKRGPLPPCTAVLVPSGGQRCRLVGNSQRGRVSCPFVGRRRASLKRTSRGQVPCHEMTSKIENFDPR